MRKDGPTTRMLGDSPGMTASVLILGVASVIGLIALGGCAQGTGSVGERLKQATTGTSPSLQAGNKDSKASKDSTKESSKKSSAPDIDVRPLSPRTEAARRSLDENFEGFLDRDPLGFDRELVVWGRGEVERLRDQFQETARAVEEATPLEILGAGLPFLIVALFLAGYFLLTRQVGRLTHGLQAEMHFEFSRWTTRILRGLILVAGRLVAVAILVALSYFPIRAVFGGAPWTRMLTATLWLLVGYRTVSSLFVALFSGRVLNVSEEHARRLERLGINGARIVVGFLVAIRWIDILGYPPELKSFVTFAYRIALISFPIALYRAKDAVLDLLPDEVGSRAYQLFNRGLTRNYRAFMAGTAGLLAFRAAGFVRASDFILVRGYAIVALIVVVFALYANFRRYVRDRVAPGEADSDEETPLQGPDRTQLSRHLEQLVGLALFVAVASVSLDLLLLLDPALIVLRIPFLAVGKTQISTLTIVNLGFVVFGTVLATKLLRALLNSQIYPMLEVDVGVAYAINTIIKYVLILIGFFLALAAVGVDLTAVTVVLASLGVGIGFGLQTLVENLISGFILLFGRSVEKGDYITVDDTYGQVQAVGARSVVIKTPDNFEMLVPSKEIVGGRIINWSYEDNQVRARLGVGVSYNSEPSEVRDVLLDTCDSHEHVLETPDPSVRLAEFGDSSIDFELLFFFDCRETTERKVIGELNFEIWKSLEEAGIEIPFPQRDLHFKSDDDWEGLESIVEARRASDESDPTSPEGRDGPD